MKLADGPNRFEAHNMRVSRLTSLLVFWGVVSREQVRPVSSRGLHGFKPTAGFWESLLDFGQGRVQLEGYSRNPHEDATWHVVCMYIYFPEACPASWIIEEYHCNRFSKVHVPNHCIHTVFQTGAAHRNVPPMSKDCCVG
eukprot:3243344-Amphidinium_carterae.1